MKSKVKQIVGHKVSKFAVIGIINTACDLILLNILRVLTDTKDTQTTKLIMLNIISAMTVAILSYHLNGKYVFKDDKKDHKKLVMFMLVTLSSIFIVQSLVIRFTLAPIGPFATWLKDFVRTLNIPIVRDFKQSFYSTNIAKVCATVASMIWNFTLYNKLVFKKK